MAISALEVVLTSLLLLGSLVSMKLRSAELVFSDETVFSIRERAERARDAAAT